jgi:cytochrome c biogenesis protein CcdA
MDPVYSTIIDILLAEYSLGASVPLVALQAMGKEVYQCENEKS